MNVPFYEKLWMWVADGISVAFAATVLITSIGGALQPPSVETIDPTLVFKDPRFAHAGVIVDEHETTVITVGMMLAYVRAEIRVPLGKRITFRMTSADVTHGFLIVGTNVNTMLVSGYVSQFTTSLQVAGEYLMVFNEYCGLGNHLMAAKLIVAAAKL